MTFETSRFGAVTAPQKAIFTFPQGLIGIPYTQWVLISTDPESPFLWLQSVEDADMALPITLPETFYPNYICELLPEQAEALGIDDENQPQVEVFCIVSAKDALEDFTINLSGPLVVNSRDQLGMQVINYAEDYSVRAPLWGEIDISEVKANQPQVPTATAEEAGE